MMKSEERVETLIPEAENLLQIVEEISMAGHSSFWEERAEVLRAIISFLTEALEICRHTECRIEETVNHDRIIWPKTEFGTNRFEQLRDLDFLIHPENNQ